MKLLIKFPTRGRREKFFSVLDMYIEKADNIKDITFLISLDLDDLEMNNNDVIQRLKEYQNKYDLYFYYGSNNTKVEAVNADMDKINFEWDILLLASDDMIPQEKGYDEIIRNHMKEHFPDTDGVLWYDDGFVKHLNTLSIMGKKYYERFSYIYHPSYKSLWCDNEYQEIFIKLNRYCHFDRVIIKHEHPIWTGKGADSLLFKNDSHDPYDRENFKKRKEKNFEL